MSYHELMLMTESTVGHSLFHWMTRKDGLGKDLGKDLVSSPIIHRFQ